MTGDQRRDLICRQTLATGGVTVSNLQEQLSVSAMTIWRDLGALEKAGAVKRVHGGAVPIDEEAGPEPRFAVKAAQFASAKGRIAAYAVKKHIKPGMVLALEGGTTVAAIMKFLPKDARLTVLTNSMEVVRQSSEGISLLCSGGIYRPVSGTLVGPHAVSFIRQHRADLAFISSTAVDAEIGLMDPNPLEIEVKKQIANVSNKVIGLLDGSKWEKRSTSPALSLKELNEVITDVVPPTTFAQTLKENQVNIEIAPR